MTKSFLTMSKRVIAAALAALTMTAALSGCDMSGADFQGAETLGAAAPETAEAPRGDGQGGGSAPAENRRRIGNGLITAVEALSMYGKCIAADSAFRITTSEDVSEEEIRSRISMSPEAEFSISKEKSGSYILSGAVPLPEGSLVKLAAADERGDVRDSWAFQTAEKFGVKSVYPADGSDTAPISSGIEVEFSLPADTESAKEFFEISPPLEGRFESHRNTLYYIPREKMELDTAYTVTLKAGLRSSLAGELEEDFSFEFKTGGDADSYFYVYNLKGGISETYLEGDPAIIEVFCSKDLWEEDFDVALYRYESAEDYRAVFEKFAEEKSRFASFSADVSGLEKVFSSSGPTVPNLEKWRPHMIMLPDDLEAGYYLADISAAGMREQYMVQVNPISVYAISLGGENAFFINDAKTGNAAAGAEVSLTLNGKTYSSTADGEGAAYINTGSDESAKGVLSVRYGGGEYIDFFSNSAEGKADYVDKYFMYLYTDREAYLTSDTMNVWGVILPRRDGVAVPEKLSLRFGTSEEGGEVNELTVAPDGTFRTKFTFKDRRETWGACVQLLDGENGICEKRVMIKDYVKPTYTVDTSLPDYAIMPHKDPVPLEISARFYEGTPAKELTFETNTKSAPAVIKTDANGHAEAELIFDDRSDWHRHEQYVSVQLTGVENEYSDFIDVIPSFYRDVMLETEYDKEKHALTLKTTQFDLGRVGEFLADGKNDYNILKDKPFDTEITVSVEHQYTVKVKTDTYYDYIEKRTVDKYSYHYRTKNIGTFTARTVNGVAVLEDLPTTSEEGGYKFSFTYSDSTGQDTLVDAYYSNGERGRYYDGSPYEHYYFDSGKNSYDGYYNYEYYDSFYYHSSVPFEENETLDLKLVCTKADASERGGRVFLAVYQDDLISRSVYPSRKLKYAPSLECLPNARFEGAYFDGRHVYPVSGGSFKFEPKQRNVRLEVTTDREVYDAGDTVRLSVRAEDERGRPVAGAPVMLSVADEAAFAVMPQSVDILNDVYAFINYAEATNYYSYIQHVIGIGTGSEKGGGGDDSGARDYFNDNPYFGSATTDADGGAEFEFELADNLTTWRATLITAKCLETGRMIAGDATFPIVAKRPVFVNPIMLPTYIEGDDIAVAAKCEGITAEDEITVRLTGGGVDKTLSVKPAETANFGKLPIGEYKVLFSAEKDGDRDAIKLPLTVTDTILETDVYRKFDLADGIDVKPEKWPITLTFFNKEYMFYTDILWELASYYGSRNDMNMAGGFARMELGWLTEEEYLERYKAESGFIRVLPNAEESAKHTAALCTAVPELMDCSGAAARFGKMLSSRETSKEDICIAYMGLAALGEPVLEEVKAALGSGEFTDYYDAMRLTAALAMCGDYNAAYEYFVELTPDVSVRGGDPEKISAVVEADGNESRERTQLALVAASLLKLPEANYFVRYLYEDKGAAYDSCAAELVTYLKNYVPETEGDAAFTYELNGRTETAELERYYGKRVQFGEEQFKNADFRVKSGEILVTADYIGRVSEQGEPAELDVTKKMTGDFSVGGEVTVVINAPKGSSVDDVIPSCGRYIESGGIRSGQRISLSTDQYGRASYKFRIVAEGEFVVESAVAQSRGEWGESGREKITVE